MSIAVQQLAALMQQLDDRDDVIVDLITELKAQVEALRMQVNDLEEDQPEIAAAVAKLSETLGKFDSALAPENPEPPSA